MITPSATPDFLPTTPRVLRVNLPRAFVRTLLADVETWRAQAAVTLTFSGVIYGDNARLYFSVGDATLPPSLIALCLRYIRQLKSSMAVCGQWIISTEIGPVLDEAQLWQEAA